MYVQDLVDYVRANLLDDTVEPYLWSDDFLTKLALEAEKEACKRVNLIIKTMTITTTPDIDEYDLPDDVIRVIRVILSEDKYAVEVFKRQFSATNTYNTKGQPVYYNYISAKRIKIFPIPDKEYNLNFIYSSYPNTTIVFEIPEEHQLKLAYYIAGNALLSEDIDTNNLTKAQYFLTKFDNYFPDKNAKSLIREKLGSRMPYAISGANKFGFP